jgi:hypothetical protein
LSLWLQYLFAGGANTVDRLFGLCGISPMDYSAVKEAVQTCPELVGVDYGTLAELFWDAKEKSVERGRAIYEQGAMLDGSFCLLLGGTLSVWIDGASVAELSAPILVGESAFATASHHRSATVKVSSESATLLEFRPTEYMLTGPLSRLFSEVAWDRWLGASRMYPS